MEPYADCGLGPDVDDGDVLQCAGRLWRAKPQDGEAPPSGVAARRVHFFFPDRGHRQPARWSHPPPSAKSQVPLSIAAGALEEDGGDYQPPSSHRRLIVDSKLALSPSLDTKADAPTAKDRCSMSGLLMAENMMTLAAGSSRTI